MIVAMTTPQDILNDPQANYPFSTVACFDATTGELPRRQLDRQRNRVFLERLAAAGADGLLIAASTGQGHLRTSSELQESFATSAEAE